MAFANPWADQLGSCITDVIASRPANPLEALVHLLRRPDTRPNWNETAAAYAKRHNLEQQLSVAIDAVGLAVLEDAPQEAIDRLCRELLILAQPQVTDQPQLADQPQVTDRPQVAEAQAVSGLQEEVASLKAEVGRLHDERLAVPQPRGGTTGGGTVLAVALGGGSDVIGALAWARASGFERAVLVQPGSPPRVTPSPTPLPTLPPTPPPSLELQLQPVQPAAAGSAAPGGNFYDNGAMVAYLLSIDTQLVAGSPLVHTLAHPNTHVAAHPYTPLRRCRWAVTTSCSPRTMAAARASH